MATTPYTSNLKRQSPGIYRDNLGGLVTQKTLNNANQQFGNWANQIKNYQYGTKEYHDTATNLSKYGKQYGYNTNGLINSAWKGGNWADPATQNSGGIADASGLSRVQTRLGYLQKYRPKDPEIAQLQKRIGDYNTAQANKNTTTTAETAPAVQTPQPQETPAQPQGSAQSPMTQALMNALGKGLNTMQAYEPKNFEGSPMYQFQKQKGMQDLEKLMASRGLTNSGAEVQANSDFLANINATEAEKQRQYADQASQRAQQAMQFIANYDQAERSNLTEQQQFEAGRDDRRKELAINFLNNILGLQAQNDVARISAGGLDTQTGLSKALLSAITSNIGSNVPRVSGGAGAPPPPPSSVAGNNALAQILAQYGNSANNNDVWNTLFKSIGF